LWDDEDDDEDENEEDEGKEEDTGLAGAFISYVNGTLYSNDAI
jgi:hypothetical protein